MKKTLLRASLAALCIFGASQAADARNAYAYDIQVDRGETSATVTYKLNDAATAVKVQLISEGAVVSEVDGTTTTEATNTVTLPLKDLVDGKTYSFRVVTTSDVVTTPTVDSKGYRFYHPQGVAVDNSTESPYFGRVYATECITTTSSTYLSGTSGNGIGAALYAFEPTLEVIANKDGKLGFTGGMTIQAKFPNGSTTAYDCRKIKIADDGRVFLTRQAYGVSPIVQVDPTDLNANFTDVLTGFTTDASTYELLNSDSEFAGAPNVGFSVTGSGSDLRLLALSANATGFGYNSAGYSCNEYALGDGKNITGISKNIAGLSKKYTVSPTNANVSYDNKGGIWYSQYRATPSETQPSLIHINAEGVEDYKDIKTVCRGGGLAFNPDFTKVAIADAASQVGIYTIGTDSDGKPTLTRDYYFATTIGGNCNEIAWDVANNLYIVGNSGEWLKVVALPRESGDVAVNAASKYSFSANVGAEEIAANAAKVVAANGEITVVGDAAEIAVYSASGALISKGETNVKVAAGIYVVVVDGKATKVVVK